MSSPFFFGPGGVVSADIAVPDHDAEHSFYAKVLTTGATPFWREDLLNRNGTPIIGLGKRTPEYEAIPLQWMPHFQVADVATSVARAIELGGHELLHGKDNEGNSQWACLADGNGAAFGIIPAVDEAAARAYGSDETPYISWLSLASPDVQTTRAFYERVVGLSSQPSGDTSGHEIHSAADDDSVPPVWMLHLPVNDLSESLRHAVENGGKVLRESHDHRRAVVQDPIGVCIGLQSS